MSYCYTRFDLAEIGELRVDRLSMGQRQRVRLALAFLHAPMLVLLDEPATSLDTSALELLRGAVDDVVRRGGMCLAVAPEGAETGLDAAAASCCATDGWSRDDALCGRTWRPLPGSSGAT